MTATDPVQAELTRIDRRLTRIEDRLFQSWQNVIPSIAAAGALVATLLNLFGK